MHDTWAARDLPVLDATIDLLEQSFMVTVTDIAARTKLTPAVVAAALEALDPIYVDFRKTTTGGDPRYWYVFKVTPEARRAVGQWPTAESLASALAAELAAGARDESDAQRQGLLAYAARLIGETLRDATVRAAGRVLAPAFGGLPVPELGMPVPEPEPLAENEYPSLVDLPELPELLRNRAPRTSPVPEPAEPSEPESESAVPEAQLLEPLPEPDGLFELDEPTSVQPAVPAAQLLEPLPEPDELVEDDEPSEEQQAVPATQLLEPLPEAADLFEDDEPGEEQQAVPATQLLEPLPEADGLFEDDELLEDDEPSEELQPPDPEPAELEPHPGPVSSDASEGADAQPQASALSAEPDEVTAP